MPAPADTPVLSLPIVGQIPSATYDVGNGYLYVMNGSGDSVIVVRGTTAIGTVRVGEQPGYAVYDSGNGYMYVLNDNSANVSVVDGLTVVGSVDVGQYPGSAVYDDRNGYVYVLDGEDRNGSNNITVISGTSVVGTVLIPTSGYGDGLDEYATYDSGNGYVYLVNPFETTVIVLNGTSVVASVNVNVANVQVTQPQSPTYDPANGYVYVMAGSGSNIAVLDGTKLIGAVTVGEGPGYAAYDSDNGYLYVSDADSNEVSVVNGTSLIGSVEVGLAPTDVICDGSNGYVYVGNGRPSISVINGTSAIDKVSLNWEPDFLTYDPEDGYVYATTVEGGPDPDDVSALLVAYPVSVTASGLPVGIGWWVNVTLGPSTWSNSSTLEFSEPYGTYNYSVSTSDEAFSAPSGSLIVNSGLTLLEVQFSKVLYTAEFWENGLPSGTAWSVTLGHAEAGLAPAAIDFSEANGTYSYTIGMVPGWTTSHFSGSITVNGSGVSLGVAWTNVTYEATFTETGLPKGTSWAVNLSGTVRLSTSTTILFALQNGTYPYSVSTTNLNYSAFGGFLGVAGFPVAQTLAFFVVAYPVTFSESGLPPGSSWSVTLGSATESGAGNLAFWAIPNGTHSFSIGSVPLYTSSPQAGTVRVNGLPVSESITFTRSVISNGNGSATFLGLPAAEGYSTLEGIVVAALAVALAVVLLRKRPGRTPPEPIPPPSGPDVDAPPSSP
jgi:YVTN family beta-propeller protein